MFRFADTLRQIFTIATLAGVARLLRPCPVVLLISLAGALAQAQPQNRDSEDDLLSLESPVVQRILRRAAFVEHRSSEARDQEYAARMYCVASHLGSLEAQYRLGKMLLEGRGIQMSIEKAATLFSIASGNGHEGATAMLAATGARKIKLPDCMENPETSVEAEARQMAGG